ncbi:DUF4276 family protein [Myxococcota bacterium]|nr:DUF4276 family protein [Myxococcota bacterium]
MKSLVIFLEEPSAREMLNGILPRLLPPDFSFECIVFAGKQDLEKRLPGKLRAWQRPDTYFVVVRDQDSGDCRVLKERLLKLCIEAGKPETLVRIACHELESFYLGDLLAVAQGIGPEHLAKEQDKAKYRNPDKLTNAKQELKKLVPDYQPLSGSRAIGPYLNLQKSHSVSFNALIRGLNKIVNSGVVV